MGEPAGPQRWLLVGQVLLRRGGVGAVKLGALASETGLTTGSFYHHFHGMESFLADLARYFGAEQIEVSLRDADDPDPRVRLSNIVRRSRDDDMTALYGAMRTWAESSAEAERAVRAADHRMLAFVESAFRDLGHDVESSRMRAMLLMSLGVARVHPPWRIPGNFNDRVLGMLEDGAEPE